MQPIMVMPSLRNSWLGPIALAVAMLLLSCRAFAASASPYLIGTYYFPGWTHGAKGLMFLPDPWAPIRRFPEREPRLGWYSDSDPKVLQQQAEWMRDYGIDFVVFDWYWDGKAPFLEQAVSAFKQATRPKDLKYSLLWANHFEFPGGMAEYRTLVAYWIKEHFSNPAYLTIDGRPVVFIFGLDHFDDTAKKLGVPMKDLVRIADQMSEQAGLRKPYFVGGTPALNHWVNGMAPKAGFSALSAYNYHSAFAGSAETEGPAFEGFAQMDQAYRTNWNWISKHASLPYIVPMSVGWDQRPWGGSKNPRHDESISTPDQFETHLRAGKALMDSLPASSPRIGVVCCWNEFGEGSFIEPTRRDGFVYLERLRKVFKPTLSVK